MTHTWLAGELLRVETNASGHLTAFDWRGRRHRLLRVVQQWQVDTDWWDPAGRVWRDYHTVITREGLLCTLYFDHLTCEWRLAKVYD